MVRRLLWALPGAVLLAGVAPARAVDARPPHAHGPADAVYSLPRFSEPEHLALGGDGALYMTDEFAGVVRLRASGQVQSVLEDTDDADAQDIAAAPDGSVWVAYGGEAVQLTPTGDQLSRPAYGDVIAAAGDAVWVASSADSPRATVERLSPDGGVRKLRVRVPRYAGFGGIAAAPDGSVWFAEGDYGRAWIGRLTPDGRSSRWAVPGRARDFGRIAAGPDGAVWFTEPHAIGRITAAGQMTSFPLAGRAVPHDLAVAGGSVWFTSDACLGRMSSDGRVTTWPVPGALKLRGIAPAGDGSVWLADRIAGVIRHFDPAAAAPAPCGAPTLTRRAGATAATLSFERTFKSGSFDEFRDIRIHIARHGRVLLAQTIPDLGGTVTVSNNHWLTVRDLDGDGEPEVLLLLGDNGTVCCTRSRIYRYDRARNTYVLARHEWGDGAATPVLRDLDGDGRPELVSRDGRFLLFTKAAVPLQVWAYRHGRLRDVTRRYPRRIRRDAARTWRLYLQEHRRFGRIVLPAWMADQYLLGRRVAADRVLEQAAAAGRLKRYFDVGPRDPWAYVRFVEATLRRLGYGR